MQSNSFTYHTVLTRTVGLSISLFMLSFTVGWPQSTKFLNQEVFIVVEYQPEFPGGFKALKEYMQKNLYYPPNAQKAGIKGRVFVSFIVETDGHITDIQLLKGIGYGCDEEAINVVSTMPKWIPGSQSGKLLRVMYHLPVLFGIDYPKPKTH